MKKVVLISIIALVVIVVIAVVLIFFLGGKQKPDPISSQCSFACQSGQKVSFCSVERVLSNGGSATCDQLSSDSQYSSYDVQTCPSISCVVSEEEAAHLADQTCVTGLGGKWVTPVTGETCPQSGAEVVRQLIPSDNPPVTGQICCG